MDTTARVETDGTISFPYVGRIQGGGVERRPVGARNRKTIGVASDRHRAPRAGRDHHLRHASQRPRARWACREFTHSIGRRISRNCCPARADCGIPPWAERSQCAAARRSRKFDSKEVQAGRGPAPNLRIANNDEVFVDLAPFYYLYGYVAKRANIRLLRPLTVQQAISIGGGLATLGSEWRIRIKRKSGNGQTYEVPASLDDQVEAGDTIIVSERIF